VVVGHEVLSVSVPREPTDTVYSCTKSRRCYREMRVELSKKFVKIAPIIMFTSILAIVNDFLMPL